MEYITFENFVIYVLTSYFLLFLSVEIAQFYFKYVSGEYLNNIDVYPIFQLIIPLISLLSIIITIGLIVYAVVKPNHYGNIIVRNIACISNEKGITPNSYYYARPNEGSLYNECTGMIFDVVHDYCKQHA